MTDEIKVPEAPKATVEVPVSIREAIENAVILENETVPEREISQEEATDSKPSDESPELKPESEEVDQVAKIKAAVQKRIDKVVAKQKSTEEELVEAKAEIERLRSNPKAEVIADKKNDGPPTQEQVKAYIIKMKQEGNVEEEVAAIDYLLTLKKDAAIKEVEERQNKTSRESQEKAARETAALQDLAKDYISYDENGQPDMKSDLTLANQKGKLFQTALALYNDVELRSQYYNDPDRALAFRRAVQDANRELHAQGLIKTPKVDGIEVRRDTRQVLADPDAVEIDDSPQPSSPTLPSDAEKVRDEIKSRNSRMRITRRAS